MNVENIESHPSQAPPTVLIVGTGAIGAFYGGKLAQAGARVSTLCRTEYDAVKSSGIEVKSVWGDFRFKPARVVRSAEEYGSAPDFIIASTKVILEVSLPELIRATVGPKTSIVILQNGIDIERPTAEAFPKNEIIGGIAFIAVRRSGLAQIEHLDYGRLVLGRYPSGTSKKAAALAELFNASGVPCEVSEEIVTARWRKLVWNAPLNPISVLAGGIDTQVMIRDEKLVEIGREAMAEVVSVAEAAGHKLPDTIIEENIQGTIVMKPFKTSMLQDYEAGRPLEVEAIVGNAVRIAESLGVPVPRLKTLYALLSCADRMNRQRRSSQSPES